MDRRLRRQLLRLDVRRSKARHDRRRRMLGAAAAVLTALAATAAAVSWRRANQPAIEAHS